ncbi:MULTISPECIES: hypothetical protein [unclassified Microcoleus]|uniref:hypothetical protein n=1 Tax=unclassified Microcoleus TaxID=2642155 RepID=UPI0025F6D3B0|nr:MULTISPECIES: hypothetical protein [unclassified Microcoleus]
MFTVVDLGHFEIRSGSNWIGRLSWGRFLRLWRAVGMGCAIPYVIALLARTLGCSEGRSPI